MDEKMELMEVETTPVEVDYEESGSGVIAGLIGLGIGVAGTLLAGKVVKGAKNIYRKAKAKKAEKQDIIDLEDEDFEEVDSEDSEEESEE